MRDEAQVSFLVLKKVTIVHSALQHLIVREVLRSLARIPGCPECRISTRAIMLSRI